MVIFWCLTHRKDSPNVVLVAGTTVDLNNPKEPVGGNRSHVQADLSSPGISSLSFLLPLHLREINRINLKQNNLSYNSLKIEFYLSVHVCMHSHVHTMLDKARRGRGIS